MIDALLAERGRVEDNIRADIRAWRKDVTQEFADRMKMSDLLRAYVTGGTERLTDEFLYQFDKAISALIDEYMEEPADPSLYLENRDRARDMNLERT